MKEHFLDGSVTQPFWDNSVEPRLEIDRGDVVVFDCPEPTGQITPVWTVETLEQYDPALAHALISSVYVKGAEPGDALEVEVLDFQHKGWGWSGHIPEFGLLAEDFDYPYLHHWRTNQGYETMNMIRKGQIEGAEKGNIAKQNQFIARLFE